MPIADNLESLGPLFQRANSLPEYIERVHSPNAGLAALKERQGAFGCSNSLVDQPATRVGRVRSLPGRTIPTEGPAGRVQKRQNVATSWNSVVTWAAARNVIKAILPISESTLRALLWDAISVGSSLLVLKNRS